MWVDRGSDVIYKTEHTLSFLPLLVRIICLFNAILHFKSKNKPRSTKKKQRGGLFKLTNREAIRWSINTGVKLLLRISSTLVERLQSYYYYYHYYLRYSLLNSRTLC